MDVIKRSLLNKKQTNPHLHLGCDFGSSSSSISPTDKRERLRWGGRWPCGAALGVAAQHPMLPSCRGKISGQKRLQTSQLGVSNVKTFEKKQKQIVYRCFCLVFLLGFGLIMYLFYSGIMITNIGG